MSRAEQPGADGVDVLAWLPHGQRDPEFASAERQRAWAEELEARSIRRALWMYETASEAAVTALQARLGLSVNPLVPNMRAYLRDASDYGVVGAARHRFRRLRVLDQARIAWHNAPRALAVLARDFATGVLVMVEMELVRFRPYAPSSVVLNASVTDLALALDNDRLLREFVRLVERTYGLEAGLATYNYGVLIERLRGWAIRPGGIVAPFNPRGYLMQPSLEECERTLKASDVPVIASHIEVDGLVSRPEALAYLRGLGIRQGLVELAPGAPGLGAQTWTRRGGLAYHGPEQRAVSPHDEAHHSDPLL